MKPKILAVEDDINYLDALRISLATQYSIEGAKDLKKGREKASDRFSLFLLDIRLGGEGNVDGIILLSELKNRFPDIPVVMMTAYGSVDLAVEAMKKGAADFVIKGNPEHLETVIERTLKDSRLKEEVSYLRTKVENYEPWEIVGKSQKIEDIRQLAKKAAMDGRITVLILGGSGTGKELVARAIHRLGKRNKGPFIAESLKARESEGGIFESLIFGHEKGAFTGAVGRRKGLFELADGGVLFLDEIGDLDWSTQAKLLRVLETRRFTRLGGSEEFETDVQLVCATNMNIGEAVSQGKFREDLYYRLNVFIINTPRLFDIPEDVALLANHFLLQSRKEGRAVRKISRETMDLLKKYPWPGNVRELKNCIERATIFAEDIIEPEHLPESVRKSLSSIQDRNSASASFSVPKEGIDIRRELAKTELAYIESALNTTYGKKSEVWKLLGYNNRHALRRRIVSLISSFPDLLNGYPYIQKKYHKILEED